MLPLGSVYEKNLLVITQSHLQPIIIRLIMQRSLVTGLRTAAKETNDY